MESDRKKEVINICLDHFIENGLTDTSTRSLSGALQLQNAGLYYYFATKDEVVVVCAEEAARRIENALIPSALNEINDPDLMMHNLQKRADEMAATMRFLVSVCSNKRYIESVRPVLDRLAQRYEYYAEQVAKRLGCSKDTILPHVYMLVTAVANYMIFGDDTFIAPQMQLMKEEIKRLLPKK